MASDLSEYIWATARQSRHLDPVWKLYGELAEMIRRRGLACRLCGRCCRFEQFGHRLYVTTLELAAFCSGLARQQPTGRRTCIPPEWSGTGCPFQTGSACGIHQIRPLGCRIFFCDEVSAAWQHEMYERLHAQLRRLHDVLQVPYRYLEWRQGLRAALALGTGRPPAFSGSGGFPARPFDRPCPSMLD